MRIFTINDRNGLQIPDGFTINTEKSLTTLNLATTRGRVLMQEKMRHGLGFPGFLFSAYRSPDEFFILSQYYG